MVHRLITAKRPNSLRLIGDAVGEVVRRRRLIGYVAGADLMKQRTDARLVGARFTL